MSLLAKGVIVILKSSVIGLLAFVLGAPMLSAFEGEAPTFLGCVESWEPPVFHQIAVNSRLRIAFRLGIVVASSGEVQLLFEEASGRGSELMITSIKKSLNGIRFVSSCLDKKVSLKLRFETYLHDKEWSSRRPDFSIQGPNEIVIRAMEPPIQAH